MYPGDEFFPKPLFHSVAATSELVLSNLVYAVQVQPFSAVGGETSLRLALGVDACAT